MQDADGAREGYTGGRPGGKLLTKAVGISGIDAREYKLSLAIESTLDCRDICLALVVADFLSSSSSEFARFPFVIFEFGMTKSDSDAREFRI